MFEKLWLIFMTVLLKRMENGTRVIKLDDFGIAKLANDSRTRLIGTMDFLPPVSQS
jgi:serine/threonine protein kinase